ncbi:MAG: TolC family outer membrane protein [Comamonadaceae bacterium]|jgi:outer membrane protein/protease secretion system outer membrane protein|nr:TolC family outer membrane protein [Comamonadaceae bacterium]
MLANTFAAKPLARLLAQALGAVSLWAGLSGMVWSMDFQQAYDAAVDNDATIRASRAGTAASRERLPQARAQLRPNVTFNAGRNYNDLTSEGRNMLGQPSRSETEYYSGNQTLSVRQPLYRPYLTAQLRQAQAQVEDANAILERDEQALVVRVGEAYFEALLARDQLNLVLAQKETYSTQLDAARKGFAAGSGTRTDVDEAQARLDMTVAQELEARQNMEFTRHRIAVLTGQPVEDLAKLDVERFMPMEPVPASVDDWIGQAEQSSPELQSLRAQLETARQEIEKTRAGHLPTLDAVAQWARTNSDSVTSVNSRYDNKTIGLQLSVPLYAGGYVSSTVRQAVATQERVQEMLEATRRDLGVRVHREFRGVTEGVLRIKALEQAVHSAEQAVVSNRKSFQAGSRTTLDVLNAEQQKTMALRDLAQARYLYLVSRLRLQSLAGEDRLANVAQINRWLMR